MLLAKLIDLILGKATQMVSLALITLAILILAARPHVDGGDDAHDLEADAHGDAGHVLRAVLLGEDERGDDAADLAAADGEGGGCAAFDVADDLVDAGERLVH